MQEHEDNNTEKKGTATPLGNLFTSSRQEVQRLEEEVMTLKLREMHTIIELKEHRLKIMELETQVIFVYTHIIARWASQHGSCNVLLSAVKLT